MANKKTFFPVFIILHLLLNQSLTFGAKWPNSTVKNNSFECIEKERKALLKFKETLNDPFYCLSSWVGNECCKWVGVECNKKPGNVIRLHLRGTDIYSKAKNKSSTEWPLSGKLNPSLLDLKHLNYLDLSHNDFENVQVPSFLGSLSNLLYLNLSYSSFTGMVPSQLGNLSHLKYLSIATPSASSSIWASDLSWLSGLKSLQYLDLSSVNLSLASNFWLQPINRIPTLSFLSLSNCKLANLPQTLPFVNLTSLSFVDLSFNHFDSLIPEWLSNISTLSVLNLEMAKLKGNINEVSWSSLCKLHNLDLSSNTFSSEVEEFVEGLSICTNSSLEVLDLGFNELKGNLPTSLGYLKNLRRIWLEGNKISGSIPSSIGNLSHLAYLDLSHNIMNGTIAKTIGQLTELSTLNLDGNFWEGTLTEIHFHNLTSLSTFYVSSKMGSLVFNVTQNWVAPFNLVDLEIHDCSLGHKFPSWLKTQRNLMTIVLQKTEISDTIPDWFWDFSPQIIALDLSYSKIKGTLPKSLNFGNFAAVNLGFNYLEGSIPIWYGVTYLSLSNNFLSGSIPSNLGLNMSLLEGLDLSGNLLNGTIPSSIMLLNDLTFLDLSNNSLSGKIPSFSDHRQHLYTIDLSSNNLSGGIPSWMCASANASLRIIQLSNNNLSEDLSSTLQNCIYMYTLDLGDNTFFGTIPKWLGNNLTNIRELRLKGNALSGTIPESLCNLPHLHVLDMSHNNLSGYIPSCIGNMTGFKSPSAYFIGKIPSDNPVEYSEHMDLSVKGRSMEYTTEMHVINLIDLSSNHLYGEIPSNLTKLSYLVSLNLSHNHLTGVIPTNMGKLHQLESLDLSNNNLKGPIPQSMASLTFLEHLNLSYNNLFGEIPQVNQFHTLIDPSIYEGNPHLCGTSLPTKCSKHDDEDHKFKQVESENIDKSHDKLWLYLSIGLGYIVGFWAVCGSLVLKESWRHGYFKFVDSMKNRIFVVMVVGWARFERKFKKESN